MDNQKIKSEWDGLVTLLQGCGFSLGDQSSSATHFGNRLAVLTNEDIRLRMSEDRGDIYMEVASSSGETEWHGLFTVLSFLGFQLTADAPLEAVARMACDNSRQISKALGDSMKCELRDFERRLAQMKWSSL